jgi:hypothetical protein
MSGEISIEQILELPELADVRKELSDPKYASRSHGSRATYALKCGGPLCKKAERDRARRRNETKARLEGRKYIPSDSRMYDRDDLLEDIIVWHKRNLAMRKLSVKEAS